MFSGLRNIYKVLFLVRPKYHVIVVFDFSLYHVLVWRRPGKLFILKCWKVSRSRCICHLRYLLVYFWQVCIKLVYLCLFLVDSQYLLLLLFHMVLDFSGSVNAVVAVPEISPISSLLGQFVLWFGFLSFPIGSSSLVLSLAQSPPLGKLGLYKFNIYFCCFLACRWLDL